MHVPAYLQCMVDNRTCLFPANSSFLLTNMSRLRRHTRHLGTFDLVVADPPWTNGSVRRGARYSTMSEDDIMDVPVPFLMAPSCLVALWITNNKQCIAFAKVRTFSCKNTKKREKRGEGLRQRERQK